VFKAGRWNRIGDCAVHVRRVRALSNVLLLKRRETGNELRPARTEKLTVRHRGERTVASRLAKGLRGNTQKLRLRKPQTPKMKKSAVRPISVFTPANVRERREVVRNLENKNEGGVIKEEKIPNKKAGKVAGVKRD